MTTHSLYTVGTVNSGEVTIELLPKYAGRWPARKGVMYCHGAGSKGNDVLVDWNKQADMAQLIVSEGHPMISGENGGEQTWGNNAAMTAINNHYNKLQSMPGVKPGKIVLVAVSMGGLNALNWAARNPDKVAAIVGVMPVIDLTDIHTNNRGGYASIINAAYSGGYSNGAYGAEHNPYNRALASSTVYNSIPMKFYYGTTDTICIPEKIETFRDMLNLLGGDVELTSIPYGHENAAYDAVDISVIADFVREHSE